MLWALPVALGAVPATVAQCHGIRRRARGTCWLDHLCLSGLGLGPLPLSARGHQVLVPPRQLAPVDAPRSDLPDLWTAEDRAQDREQVLLEVRAVLVEGLVRAAQVHARR